MNNGSDNEENPISGRDFKEALFALFGSASLPLVQRNVLNFANIGCGAGGASLAAKGLGLKVVYAVEDDDGAREAYAINIGTEPMPSITLDLVKLPRIDLLWVSLPPEALAPGEPGRDESACDEAMRVLRVKRPAGTVLECSRWWGPGVDEAVDGLELLGYKVSQHILWGRCFIVGTLRPRPDLWEEGDPVPPIGGEDAGPNAMIVLRDKGFPPGWRLPKCPEVALRLALEALPVELAAAVISWVAAMMRGAWVERE